MNADKERKAIQAAGEFAKTIVRPFIIMSSWSTCLYIWAAGEEVPEMLLYVAGAILAEYVGERGVKRIKELLKK